MDVNSPSELAGACRSLAFFLTPCCARLVVVCRVDPTQDPGFSRLYLERRGVDLAVSKP